MFFDREVELGVLSCANTRARVSVVAEDVLRVTHIPATSGIFPPPRPWLDDVFQPVSSKEFYSGAWQSSVDGHGNLCLFNPEFEWSFQEGRSARVYPTGKIQFSFRMEPDEIFYGLGEWFNAFTRKDGSVTLKNQESPALFQGRQTYSTIPYLFSSRGYACFLLNSHITRWQIRPSLKRVDIEADNGPLEYLIFFGKNPQQIVSAYTALTGRPPLVPRWAFGLWVTSYPQEHQDQVVKIVEQHREHQVPLDALILDYHWEQKFHNFQWRSSLFPEPNRLVQELRSQGVRLGLIFTPFVNNRTDPAKKALLQAMVKNVPPEVYNDDERAMEEYQIALQEGYLAHTNASWWFGGGGMIDFTNPEAAAWWNWMLKPLYRQGVDFFKNDDGEYLPDDATSHNGMDGREYHNLYGFYYGRAIYQGMEELDDRRALIYARSVWAGSQRYPGIFLGDQKPDFENLRRTIRAGLNMSLLGFAYWTADVFGLDGKTTPETHMRYAQWALMVPIARYFLRPSAIDNTRWPWAFDQQVEENFQRHVRLRYKLLPYYHLLGWEAFRSGAPIIRPLFFTFPKESQTYSIDDQVMLGDQLMLAPVVESGVTSRKAYLPAGDWYNFWTEEKYTGGQEVTLPAPPDRLPLLVRGGAIIPMGPSLQFIPSGHQFEQLRLHFYPPFNGRLDWIDDDGSTRSYQHGNYSVTPVEIHSSEKQVEIKVGNMSGNYALFFARRKIKFYIHQSAEPRAVLVNGKPFEDWQYLAESRLVQIPLEIPVKQSTHITLQYGE